MVMRSKKNPRSDINRNRSTYFLLGLMLVLLLTYLALEWKTYSTDNHRGLHAAYSKDITEEVPVTIQEIRKPLTKPLLAAVELEIRDDDEDIVETVIASTEPSPDNPTLAVDSIAVLELPEEEEVPWVLIEEAPVFPGCEYAEDKKSCFQKMMRDYIRLNFRYPKPAQQLGLEGRVNAMFVIRDDGSVSDIRVRGPHEILENEAVRILSGLPDMIPAKQRGRPVQVPFSIPIYFKLQ